MRPYRILYFVISWLVGFAFFQKQQRGCFFNAVKEKSNRKWDERVNEGKRTFVGFWLSILIYIWVKLVVDFEQRSKIIFLIKINTPSLNFFQFTQALNTPMWEQMPGWHVGHPRNLLTIWGRERVTYISLTLNVDVNTLI